MSYKFTMVICSLCLVQTITSTIEPPPPVSSQETPCLAAGQSIIPGTYYLDVENCTVYFCEKLRTGEGELQVHNCRNIQRQYFEWYRDCLENDCDLGEFLLY